MKNIKVFLSSIVLLTVFIFPFTMVNANIINSEKGIKVSSDGSKESTLKGQMVHIVKNPDGHRKQYSYTIENIFNDSGLINTGFSFDEFDTQLWGRLSSDIKAIFPTEESKEILAYLENEVPRFIVSNELDITLYPLNKKEAIVSFEKSREKTCFSFKSAEDIGALWFRVHQSVSTSVSCENVHRVSFAGYKNNSAPESEKTTPLSRSATFTIVGAGLVACLYTIWRKIKSSSHTHHKK